MCTRSQHLSVSPFDYVAPEDDFGTLKSTMGDLIRKDKSIFERLSDYRFPKTQAVSTPTTPATLDSNKAPTTPESPRSVGFQVNLPSQGFSSPIRRRLSHRRSAAVSSSSTESIFENTNQAPNGTLNSNKFAYDEEVKLRKGSEHFPPQFQLDQSKPLEKRAKRVEPLIDLDVASKPLTPNLGSGLSDFGHLGSAQLKIDEESDELENSENNSEGEISLVDFLRESVSDSAMSDNNENNPFEHIDTDAGLWFDPSEFCTGRATF